MPDKVEELYIEIIRKAGVKDDMLSPASPDQIDDVPIVITGLESTENDR